MHVKGTLAIGMIAAALFSAAVPSAYAAERKQSELVDQPGQTLPVQPIGDGGVVVPTPPSGSTRSNPITDPTAGAGTPRIIRDGLNDRKLQDSTLQGADGFAFPCPGQPSTETRNLSCPGGQTGAIVEARSYVAAPAPTCWTPGPWTQISNTCATPCPAQPADEVQSLACPVGQTGTITQRRTYTSAPSPTCWTAGPWVETSNTCASTCGPRPANETRNATCPAGMTGSITESRSYTAAAFPTCWTAGAWTQTSNTCCGPQPAPQTWVDPCPSGQTGQISWQRPWVNAPAPTCWQNGEWVETGNTCAAAPPPSCPPRPADETNNLSCPSGQTGSITVVRSYTATAFPTCWTAGMWTTTSNTCASTTPPPPPPPSCPAKPDDQTQTLNCPAGFVGSGIVQTRTYVPVTDGTCWAPTAWTEVTRDCAPDLGPDLGCGPGNAAPRWLGWQPDNTMPSYQYGGACYSPEPWNPVAPPNLSGACTLGDERRFTCQDATNNYESNHFVNRCICI